MLEIAVNNIISTFDVLLTISSAIFFCDVSLIADFSILPPSSGYIGIRLNIASNMFAFIIICCVFILMK